MSIEKRLAAKKRSEQARKKEKMGKIMKIVAIVVAICILAGAVYGVYYAIQSSKTEYSKYVTEDGNIMGVNPKDYITLVDYSKMDISLKDYEPTEKELNEHMEKLMDEAEKAAKEEEKKDDEKKDDASTSTSSDAVTTAEDESKDEADKDETKDEADKEESKDDKDEDKKEEDKKESKLDSLDDAWVEKYYKKTLEEKKYEVTKKGFEEYAYDDLFDSNVETNLVKDITKYLNDKSTLKGDYPKKYTKNLTQILKNTEKEMFDMYSGFYTAYGYNNVYALYGSKKAFNEAMDTQAKAYVKDSLVCLAIYEELGLTYTLEDAKKYFKEELEEDFDEQAKRCGEPYLILNYKCDLVIDYFEDKIRAAYEEESKEDNNDKTEDNKTEGDKAEE